MMLTLLSDCGYDVEKPIKSIGDSFDKYLASGMLGTVQWSHNMEQGQRGSEITYSTVTSINKITAMSSEKDQ